MYCLFLTKLITVNNKLNVLRINTLPDLVKIRIPIVLYCFEHLPSNLEMLERWLILN